MISTENHDFHSVYGVLAISMKTIENGGFRYVRGMQKCIVMLVISTTFKVRGDISLDNSVEIIISLKIMISLSLWSSGDFHETHRMLLF